MFLTTALYSTIVIYMTTIMLLLTGKVPVNNSETAAIERNSV